MPLVERQVIILCTITEEKCSFKLWHGAEKYQLQVTSWFKNFKYEKCVLEIEESIVIWVKEKMVSSIL